MNPQLEKKLARNRYVENMHIVMWLCKDISWCLELRVVGIAMIFPTLTVAIYLTRKMWNYTSERYHNLAIIFWILANSFWMCVEFFDHEEWKHYALIPFGIGAVFVIYYYAYVARKERIVRNGQIS